MKKNGIIYRDDVVSFTEAKVFIEHHFINAPLYIPPIQSFLISKEKFEYKGITGLTVFLN